jgi:threonine dehydrogenase-like Zn-dependent dehydrogenase
MAETLYIDPRARLHQITDDIPAVTATIAHALADGWTWAVHSPRLRQGESVLILGPGPRGLACLLAAKSAGAGWVGITGLDVDSDRLEMARILGVDETVNVSAQDLQSAVANSLGCRPDLVVDVTSNDPEAIYTALEIVRPGGRVILASTKGGRPISSLYSDVIVTKQLQVMGVLGPSQEGFEWGIQQLSIDPRLDSLISHQFPLNESHLALAATSGQMGHEELISVAISF